MIPIAVAAMLFVALIQGCSGRTLALVTLSIVAGTIAYVVFVNSSVQVALIGSYLILVILCTAMSERRKSVPPPADRIVALGKRKRGSESRTARY